MRLKDTEFLVLYTIFMTPNIGVNQLYRRLKGKISKAFLIKLLRELSQAGLIKEVKDPFHKQKVRLLIKEDLQQVAKDLLERMQGAAYENLAERMSAALSVYRRAVSKVNKPLFVDFLKKLLLKEIADALESVRSGKPK